MKPDPYDIAVIGGGPGGYVAAIRAAQLGMRTALIERDQLGGICLNWGCIPTKALLHAAATWRAIHNSKPLGINFGNASLDFPVLIARSRAVAAQLSKGVRELLDKHKVTVISGEAAINPERRLGIKSKDASMELEARTVIIATGARPRELAGVKSDGDRIWNYRHALSPGTLPRSLAIIGAGATGMEFASFYATLGTRVTLVESASRLLPAGDEEVSAFMETSYSAQGISIRTNTTVDALDTHMGIARLTLRTAKGQELLDVEHVLVCVGVRANTEELGLEHTSAQIQEGRIVADPFGATDDPGVYAIGDVTGGPWLAHKASHQAVVCIERIAGNTAAHVADLDRIPSCTYGHPQTASIGMTESAALRNGRRVRVGRFPFRANGKAIAVNTPSGFVKTIFDAESGELLGAHLAGESVTEMAHSIGLALTMEATEAEFMQTVFPHPTLSEAIQESVLGAFGRALHI